MRQCSMLAVLAIVLALAAVDARILEHGSSANRQLQQVINLGNDYCPDGCQRAPTDFCQQDSTGGGLYCTKCQGTLIVKLTNGRCSCPRGKYANMTTQCMDCEKGYYCAGDDYDSTVMYAGRTACPQDMTTVGKRTETVRGCVNNAGFYYTITTNVTSGEPIVAAVVCPVDTYSPGYKKQRACVPCPTGFTTKNMTGRSRPTDCVVPAGWYLKSPGQVAPCPKGEWKATEGIFGNCTKCAFGVTTAREGSTNETECTQVVEGRFAKAIRAGDNVITATEVCPQKYYCPGGMPFAAFDPATYNATEETTIKLCKDGLWTVDLGATSPDQCLTPPGYATANFNTTKCGPDTYRADWKPANQATNCLACGTGVRADMTDRLKVYLDVMDPNNSTFEMITTSSDDCYIMPGQGLYYSTITGSWRARDCEANNYGVSNKTYGLSPAPCKDCPENMVTSTNTTTYPNSSSFFQTNTDGTKGFISALACVTQDGYGYNGRIAQQCDKGTYNAKDTRSTCTACDYGLTTSDVGSGITSADCGLAPGFGYVNNTGTGNSSIAPCPIGFYNNNTWNGNTSDLCTACPTGLTTLKEGSDNPDQCNLCQAGYGGADCATQCGGDVATYGPPSRSKDTPACLNCSVSGTGFSFEYKKQNLVYAPKAVARLGANFSGDCLTEFTQIVDGAWYLPFNTTNHTGMTVAYDIPTLQDCLDLCNVTTCMFATYDYDNTSCTTVAPNTNSNILGTGDPYIAFKAGPSGDTAVSAYSKKTKSAKAAAVSSGWYSWYWDHDGAFITGDSIKTWGDFNATGVVWEKVQDCLDSCDNDGKCAAVRVLEAARIAVEPQADTDKRTAQTCELIYGSEQLGVFKRTMVHTSITRLNMPDTLKSNVA